MGPARRARRSERGVTMIESAIATPVVLLLIFGVLEFGLLFKDYLSLANGVRDGARLASALGTEVNTDYKVIESALRRMPAVSRNQVRRIVVFKATSADSTMPTACRTGSVTNVCNSYSGADFNRPESDFHGGAGAPDRYWRPTARKDRLSDPPDYVGIWIEVRHDAATGILPLSKDLSEEVIMRIEPARV